MSDAVPRGDFLFSVSIESRDKLFNSPCLDILFAVVCDCAVNFFMVSSMLVQLFMLKSARVLSMCCVKLS